MQTFDDIPTTFTGNFGRAPKVKLREGSKPSLSAGLSHVFEDIWGHEHKEPRDLLPHRVSAKVPFCARRTILHEHGPDEQFDTSSILSVQFPAIGTAIHTVVQTGFARWGILRGEGFKCNKCGWEIPDVPLDQPPVVLDKCSKCNTFQYLEYIEHTVYDPETKLPGHADGHIEIKRSALESWFPKYDWSNFPDTLHLVLEIKTQASPKKHSRYAEAPTAPPNYYHQAQYYLALLEDKLSLEFHGVLYCYVVMGSPYRMHFKFVPTDRAIAPWARSQHNWENYARDQKILPPVQSSLCQGDFHCEAAKDCPMLKRCKQPRIEHNLFWGTRDEIRQARQKTQK